MTKNNLTHWQLPSRGHQQDWPFERVAALTLSLYHMSRFKIMQLQSENASLAMFSPISGQLEHIDGYVNWNILMVMSTGTY